MKGNLTMKKAISLVVTITVVLTCIFNFALADTFTIHNGIVTLNSLFNFLPAF